MPTAPVPILLVTGFLGAGKTTFLNWLLREHPDTKISLILNEFGDIQLESQFIEQQSGEVMELSNGCMCHVARDDVARVINYILDNAPETEYILIEASGLSDPDLIHDALRNPAITDRTHRIGTLCILDALNFQHNRQEHPIVLSQAGDADVILLSKVEEAGEEQVQRVEDLIERIMLNTTVLRWDEALEPSRFLGRDRHAAAETAPAEDDQASDHSDVSDSDSDSESDSHEAHPAHDHDAYQEYWFKATAPIDRDAFASVMRSLPASIVRAKGYIDADGTKTMVQYVPGDLKLRATSWDDETPHTAVLLLGKELDEKEAGELMRALRNCYY
jgi:G3E family GTPase